MDTFLGPDGVRYREVSLYFNRLFVFKHVTCKLNDDDDDDDDDGPLFPLIDSIWEWCHLCYLFVANCPA